MEPLHFTKEEQIELVRKNNETHFSSKFGFLNSHNGLRRGCLHLMLGTTGGGKSTVVRSILRDFIFNKDNETRSASIWLSEETVNNFKTEMSKSVPSHDALYRVTVSSELEKHEKGFSFSGLQRTLVPDLIIFDNITTSKFYASKKPSEQITFATKLKELAIELNCAVILIAHTGAMVSDNMNRLIDPNDIRGTKDVVNLAEVLYILQRFHIGDIYFPTIRIEKARGQEVVSKFYRLNYEKTLFSYISDEPISFEKFKEAYGKRNRL